VKTWKGTVCNIKEYVRMYKNKHDMQLKYIPEFFLLFGILLIH